MHMTAEALEGIDSEIQKFKMQVSRRNGERRGCEARVMRQEMTEPRARAEGQGRGQLFGGVVKTGHAGLQGE